MSVATFIPEIWSAELLSALRKNLVFGNLCNRDYEGDIAGAGDTVHINSISDPTISDYTRYGTLTYEELNTADRVLSVDQAKSFSFQVDDVDARQAAGSVMAEAMSRAAYKLADTADQFVAGLYTQAAAPGIVAEAAITSADLAYGVLTSLRTALSNANVPTQGRWAIVPPWFTALLIGDIRFAAYFTGMNNGEQPVQSGLVHRGAGFDIYESNNVPNPEDTDWIIMAGNNTAITFADQISQVEALRLQASFSDAVRGLHVYGAKVVRPEALVYAIAGTA